MQRKLRQWWLAPVWWHVGHQIAASEEVVARSITWLHHARNCLRWKLAATWQWWMEPWPALARIGTKANFFGGIVGAEIKAIAEISNFWSDFRCSTQRREHKFRGSRGRKSCCVCRFKFSSLLSFCLLHLETERACDFLSLKKFPFFSKVPDEPRRGRKRVRSCGMSPKKGRDESHFRSRPEKNVSKWEISTSSGSFIFYDFFSLFSAISSSKNLS